MAILVLPVALPVGAFFALSASPALRPEELLPLACLGVLGFSCLGFLESRIYLCELRSVVPRPLIAAGEFVMGLALIFLLTGGSSLAGYAAAKHLGLGACR